MDRQKALEEFLGDKVAPLTLGLYLWRNRFYEVLPSRLTKIRHNWSGFVRLEHKGKTWMMREASEDIIKKYYPQVYMNKNFREAIKKNPDIIKNG